MFSSLERKREKNELRTIEPVVLLIMNNFFYFYDCFLVQFQLNQKEYA